MAAGTATARHGIRADLLAASCLLVRPPRLCFARADRHRNINLNDQTKDLTE